MNVKNELSHRCFCFLRACRKKTIEQNSHYFKKCNKPKVASSDFTKYKLHRRSLMSKFSTFYTGVQKNVFCFLFDFARIFFLIAVVSPLRILGFKFHTLRLQFLFHQKFPLLNFHLNTVSLNDKDAKSLRGISSLKTLFENSEKAIRSCSSK